MVTSDTYYFLFLKFYFGRLFHRFVFVFVFPAYLGPGCLLGIELEKKLLNWIHDCGTRGLVLFRSTVLNRVRELIDENPRIKMKTPYTEDFPSRSWFYSFLRRHPEIIEQHPQLFARQSKLRKDDVNLASDSEIEFVSCEVVDPSDTAQPDVVFCPKTRQDEVEELLPSEVVDLFRSCYEEHGDEWAGPVAHTTAYGIWLKAKKEILGGRPKSGKGRKPKLNRVRRKKLKR